MTFKAFILKTIKSNIQKYYWFLLSTVFSMSVFFIFINLSYSKGFQDINIGQYKTLMAVAETITICFSVFIISYVHWYLMLERTKSFSVLLSYGMTRKALYKLITGETLLIYLVSLCMAFLTGSIFSKLFFLISKKLLGLMDADLEYQLSIKSFLITAVLFAVIFSAVLLLSLIRISKKDLIELSKSREDVELNNRGHVWAGCLGIILTGGSAIALYFHNRNTLDNMTEWVLGSALISLIGIYMIISHFGRIIYMRFKANSKRYYGNLLAASEFAKDYRQNRKTLFILTLLTFGILFFVSITYSLYSEAFRMAEDGNPHDLYYQELDSIPEIMEDYEIEEIIDAKTTLAENLLLPFIYMRAPEMHSLQPLGWTTRGVVPIVSETAYNRCFHNNYSVEPGEAVQIIILNTNNKYDILDSDILLKNDITEYHLRSKETIHKGIINQYVFAQPILLITDDTDYERFAGEAAAAEKGILHMYCFKDWVRNLKQSTAFSDEFYNRFYNDYYSGDNLPVVYDLIDRYGYSFMNIFSKAIDYEFGRMQGAFSLFIMGFVSILFAFCILNTLCFKVFLSGAQDSIRLRKLDGIGMTVREKRKLISTRIKLIMFVPALLGIIVELFWTYALNFKALLGISLSDIIFIRNSAAIGAGYLVIMLIYYNILKNSYFKRLSL